MVVRELRYFVRKKRDGGAADITRPLFVKETGSRWVPREDRTLLCAVTKLQFFQNTL